MKKLLKLTFILGFFWFLTQFLNCSFFAQNKKTSAEFLYDPDIISPAYPKNRGPKVYLDEGHYNRHTYGGVGSFVAFKNVLSKDGYQVISFKKQFTVRSLQDVRILIIPLAQQKEPWRVTMA